MQCCWHSLCMPAYQASTPLDTAVRCARQGPWLAYLQVRPEEQALHARHCKGVALTITDLSIPFLHLVSPKCGQA